MSSHNINLVVMFKMLAFVLPFLITAINCFGQLRYPVVGTFKSKSAQGMAIYGDDAFLMNDGGHCRQLDLKTGIIKRQFKLACSPSNPHVNNACFGIEKIENGLYPVIYISECREGGFHCFVESLDSIPVLLQTILAKTGDKTVRAVNWVVDRKQHVLYVVTRIEKHLDSKGSVRNTITKYRLPRMEEGKTVILTEQDVEDQFDVFFPNILQGCKIKDNYMYLVTGLEQSLSHRKDAQRAIQVIDLKKKTLLKTIDLTYLTTNEPEDIDFYRGKGLIYCGQEGGIYEIKL